MNKYGPKAHELIQDVVKKYSKGSLKSGSTKQSVKNKKQAIAIGISEARKKGYKVPRQVI